MIRATQRVGKESPSCLIQPDTGRRRGLRTDKVVPSTYTGFLYDTALTLTKRWSKSLLPIQNQAQQNDNFFFSGIKHCHCHFWWRNLDLSCDTKECLHIRWAVLPINSLLSSDSSSSDFHNQNQTTKSSFSFCQQMHESFFFPLTPIRLEIVPKRYVARVRKDVHGERKGSSLSISFPVKIKHEQAGSKVPTPPPVSDIWGLGSMGYSRSSLTGEFLSVRIGGSI